MWSRASQFYGFYNTITPGDNASREFLILKLFLDEVNPPPPLFQPHPLFSPKIKRDKHKKPSKTSTRFQNLGFFFSSQSGTQGGLLVSMMSEGARVRSQVGSRVVLSYALTRVLVWLGFFPAFPIDHRTYPDIQIMAVVRISRKDVVLLRFMTIVAKLALARNP